MLPASSRFPPGCYSVVKLCYLFTARRSSFFEEARCTHSQQASHRSVPLGPGTTRSGWSATHTGYRSREIRDNPCSFNSLFFFFTIIIIIDGSSHGLGLCPGLVPVSRLWETTVIFACTLMRGGCEGGHLGHGWRISKTLRSNYYGFKSLAYCTLDEPCQHACQGLHHHNISGAPPGPWHRIELETRAAYRGSQYRPICTQCCVSAVDACIGQRT